MSNLLRKLFSPSRNLRGPFCCGATPRSSLRSLERQCARQAIRLTGSQGEQKVTTLKIGSTNKINTAQTGGHSKTSIYPDEIGFGYLARIPLGKIQTAQTKLKTLQQQ
jgi:hypothetical protein